jgi:predicted GNAT family acetyltransferase
MEIIYKRGLESVDWQDMKAVLQADDFDNGRSPEQYEISFKNSHSTCLAYAGDRLIGTVRALSDGICNTYIVDVWTLTEFRHQGNASRMMELVTADFQGQHVYLFAEDEIAPFYTNLGFKPQDIGLGKVVGKWLDIGPSING